MNIVNQATHSLLSLSTGIVIIIALTAIFGTYAFIRGKGRGVSLILAFYPSILIYSYIPLAKVSTSAPVQAGIFAILVIAVHLILNRFIEAGFAFSSGRKVFDSLIVGIFATVLVVWATYHIASIEAIDPIKFSQNVDAVFAAKYSLYVLLAPLVALIVI